VPRRVAGQKGDIALGLGRVVHLEPTRQSQSSKNSKVLVSETAHIIPHRQEVWGDLFSSFKRCNRLLYIARSATVKNHTPETHLGTFLRKFKKVKKTYAFMRLEAL
jgi:hypothetical protein